MHYYHWGATSTEVVMAHHHHGLIGYITSAEACMLLPGGNDILLYPFGLLLI